MRQTGILFIYLFIIIFFKPIGGEEVERWMKKGDDRGCCTEQKTNVPETNPLKKVITVITLRYDNSITVACWCFVPAFVFRVLMCLDVSRYRQLHFKPQCCVFRYLSFPFFWLALEKGHPVCLLGGQEAGQLVRSTCSSETTLNIREISMQRLLYEGGNCMLTRQTCDTFQERKHLYWFFLLHRYVLLEMVTALIWFFILMYYFEWLYESLFIACETISYVVLYLFTVHIRCT